jgi:triphosphatase
MEIELKLAIAGEDMPRIKKALLAMAGDARPSRSTLTSTYYDTSEFRLQRDERILRVRKEGRRFVQTVKAHHPDSGDLLERGEWEDQIGGAEPDLTAPRSGSQMQPIKPEDLHPLFTTIVHRTVILLEPRTGTSIEVALDKGEIVAAVGEAREPISEIELELKRGDPAVLYDIALRLLETAPLRIEIRSKAERGYRLGEGSAAQPPTPHTRILPVHRKMTVEEVLQGVGRRCLAAILRNEAAVLADVAEGSHQVRVAVRRLRAVLSTLKPMLSAEHYRWANHELKWLGDALGPARDWDVVADHLLVPVMAALPHEADLPKLNRATDIRRKAAYRRVKEAIVSPHYTVTLLKLMRWFEARGWRDQPVTEKSAKFVAPIGKVAPALIQRSYRKARNRARHFATLPPLRRHKLRIALKKLRYTIELLGPLFPQREIRPFLARMRALQDDLGHANDVRSARHLLEDVENGHHRAPLDRAGGIVVGWHDRGLALREHATRRCVRRFHRAGRFW